MATRIEISRVNQVPYYNAINPSTYPSHHFQTGGSGEHPTACRTE